MDNDSMNEKTMEDVHTKEIDLVNRDPKHINDDVVKVRTSNKPVPFLCVKPEQTEPTHALIPDSRQERVSAY